ncbi:MAG: hypothetical protein SGBAC_007448 [Bacillariaceae sp.]
MNNTQQSQEWQSTIRRPRRVSDNRRRQEEDTDDQPMMPTRSSAIVDMEHAETMISTTDLYPTLSNLDRHGVAVGQLVDSPISGDRIDHVNRYRHDNNHRNQMQNGEVVQDQEMYHQLPSPPQIRRRQQVADIVPTAGRRRPRQRPQSITVPQRGVRRCLSAMTLSSDLISFDGTEFEAIAAAEDYMDDDQLHEYLDQLAKEEDRKSRERESLKEELVSASSVINDNSDRKSLQQIFQHLDFDGDGSNVDYETYLDRLVEEQLQAEQKYKSKTARRASEISC